jgi:hypothetical protein
MQCEPTLVKLRGERDYLVHFNHECDRYLGINQLQVCENSWSKDGFNLESDCYNVLDLIAEAKRK